MRFLMMVKGDKDYEAGRPPPCQLMDAMGVLAEEMYRTGAMIQMGGLLPTAQGALVRTAGGDLNVTDGPFSEAKEIVGGYAIMKASSRAQAIEYARRFLQVHIDVLGPSYEGQVEVRQLFDDPSEK